jgi:hypothetical protein
MLKRTHLWFLVAVLLSQGAVAGTDVGYELDTTGLENTAATQVGDRPVQIEDRAWVVPGVEQSTNKSELTVFACTGHSRIVAPRFHPSNSMALDGAQLPRWINEIVWPLTRDLWTEVELEPYVPLPINFDRMRIPRRGFDAMRLATQR